MEELKDRRRTLCENFARKCIKNGNFDELFQKSNKLHTMNTRKSEKFKITFARTNRLKDSAIPYMQRLLNES